MFKKIAVAVAFSPRCEAVLSEAKRFQQLYDAQLVLIHIGVKMEQDERFLKALMEKVDVDTDSIKVIWKQGNAAKRILAICNEEKIDLLLAGALRKENIFKYYIGSVARNILRKANCSVLVLTDPSVNAHPFRKIVIHGGPKNDSTKTIEIGIDLSKRSHASQIHIIKELKMFGLAMAMAGEGTENEYFEAKREFVGNEIKIVENILEKLDTQGLKINIKIMAGKTGSELSKFTQKAEADLLIVDSPATKLGLFSRVFSNDLEVIMADLPANLLIVQ